MFDDYGKFITTWGSLGTANGQFNHPEGITVVTHIYLGIVIGNTYVG